MKKLKTLKEWLILTWNNLKRDKVDLWLFIIATLVMVFGFINDSDTAILGLMLPYIIYVTYRIGNLKDIHEMEEKD